MKTYVKPLVYREGKVSRENNVVEKKPVFGNFEKYFSMILRIFAAKLFSTFFFFFFTNSQRFSLRLQRKLMFFGTLQKKFHKIFSLNLKIFAKYLSRKIFLPRNYYPVKKFLPCICPIQRKPAKISNSPKFTNTPSYAIFYKVLSNPFKLPKPPW